MLLPRPRVFVSSDALARLAAMDSGGIKDRPHIAAYRNGAVFIDEAYWEPADIADQSVLVHELVHYAQDLGDGHYACAGQREAEAYRMQNLFLIEHGERPYAERAAIEALMRCQ